MAGSITETAGDLLGGLNDLLEDAYETADLIEGLREKFRGDGGVTPAGPPNVIPPSGPQEAAAAAEGKGIFLGLEAQALIALAIGGVILLVALR